MREVRRLSAEEELDIRQWMNHHEDLLRFFQTPETQLVYSSVTYQPTSINKPKNVDWKKDGF
jgi:hypothetical protein